MRRYKISKSVGRRISLIRRQKNLTQEQVADEAGIHVSTLGRIERGESNPPLQTVNKIVQALRVKAKDLF
ncbi:helix-turn-helix transcriptional regulator [Candidatus Collierbacteria bacterium]|nr:helix-turn-helix transcriptional regulator [Candidatus Collierbacteria bacterium]